MTPLDSISQLRSCQNIEIEAVKIGMARLLKYFSVGRRLSSLSSCATFPRTFVKTGPPRTTVKLADSNPQSTSRLEVGIHIAIKRSNAQTVDRRMDA